MFRKIAIHALMLIGFIVTAALSGCESRPAAAQKLFAEGKYQQVINKYPDLEIARRARAKIAQQLVEQKNYAVVLSDYSDTPAAYQAQLAMAQELFDQGKYDSVYALYPTTQIGIRSLDIIADSMVAIGQTDSFLTKYAATERAKKIREDNAKADFEAAKKLKGNEKIKALEAILAKYMGTTVYKEASRELDIARGHPVKPLPAQQNKPASTSSTAPSTGTKKTQ